ncbi:MAG: preprotein translocase subunit SecY [Chlamydiales bacterium]|nr:preprotein translocase subunit SecY [Chlamydiales bacterium]
MDTFRRIASIPELKNRILFTISLLIVCRIGVFIPVPGINGEMALAYFKQATGGVQNLFQLVDIFSGGAFAQMTVIALGVVPYISASIIMQLMMALMPNLQREVRENPDAGRRKVNKYTRMLTVLLAVVQSTLFARYAIGMNQANPGIILPEMFRAQAFGLPWIFFLVTILTMTTGTVFLMWIGEQITEKGIGNGMSLIITIGIISSLPSTIGSVIKQLNLDSQEPGQLTFSSLIVLFAVFVLVIIATILIIQGVRKIPIQYARRVVGRREVQGGGSYVPLKINYAGVIPVIFASSLLMFPATLAQFLGRGGFFGAIANAMSPGSFVYMLIYVLLILFFTYFWTATQFHPEQIASDMKKNGAFIPGIRQGKPTQDFLESTMNRITLIGAIFLAIIAILPSIIGRILHIDPSISYFFGGTTLLILVGVVLDTMKQVESHLLMKRYEGFMKRGKR